MMRLVFPECWRELELVPGARSELLGCIADIARWNDDMSPIRLRGLDDLFGFLFDTFCFEEGAHQWVGKLIFADEAEPMQRFIEVFWRFVQESRINDPYLDTLHEARLPDNVVERAKELCAVLRRRGVPQYVDDEESG